MGNVIIYGRQRDFINPGPRCGHRLHRQMGIPDMPRDGNFVVGGDRQMRETFLAIGILMPPEVHFLWLRRHLAPKYNIARPRGEIPAVDIACAGIAEQCLGEAVASVVDAVRTTSSSPVRPA